MPRAGLDAEAVVTAAAAVADADGLPAVTLARLAGDLGVRPPSLYAHVGGLPDLRRRLAARGARELGATLRAAATGRARGEALEALAGAYRAYALAHPGTYAAAQRASDPLGTGSDYFGTATLAINYGVISATQVWYVQVAALLAGHIAGLILAHDKAIATYRDPKEAVRSQYWMLTVMVCFTSLGLWLLSSVGT